MHVPIREYQEISTAMMESAVNQVVNARMGQRQQIRWMLCRAYLLFTCEA
jgi:hypothetical protein